MANFAHYARGSVASMTQHYERKKNENGDYIKFKNQQIDTERSFMNYNLAEQKNPIEFIRERTESLKCLKRKNVNVLASWVVTVPQEVPLEHQREFFERTYDFLEKKYGKENVVSAWVHMDENTPHIHFAFVPVVYDKKKDREKVSCKECVTKLDLQKFHGELQQYLDEWIQSNEYDFECPVLNGATDGGNKTIQELKAERLEAENDALEDRFVDLMNECGERYAQINMLTEERNSLETSVLDLKAQSDELTLKNAQIASESVREQNKLTQLEQKVKDTELSLELLEANLEKSVQKNIDTFGSWENALAGIDAIKEKRAQERRISLLERFIQLPQIKPLWDSFTSQREVNKSHNRNTQERT